jgi:hypothetical protein
MVKAAANQSAAVRERLRVETTTKTAPKHMAMIKFTARKKAAPFISPSMQETCTPPGYRVPGRMLKAHGTRNR